MSKEITQYEAAGLDEKMRYVQTLSSAGDLIPKGLWTAGKPNPGKVLLVFETGAMLGIHPIAALSGIDIIEGKPAISPGLMSGVIRKAGHKLRVTTRGSIKAGDFEAVVTLTRADDPDFTYEAIWTMERATRAKLAHKDNWVKYPEAMCKARAISEVAREGAEDCLMGVKYTPEEMGALVNESGEMVATSEAIEPSEDWAALVGAVTTTDDLKALRDRAQAADEYTANRALFLARAGELGRAGEAAAEPAAEPAPDDNVIDAEIVPDDEPAAPTEAAAAEPEDEETELQRYERETAAEFESQASTNG
ncbi:hypothetical protein QMG61_05390 [Cryobacterium sp. PH31-AA6]|uniref:hypothetical protein n=1 Tax=Cryobacterium sp. PH31-AA6 TaxID=3046205 RepID=UPI0024BBB942|nr:hypothetical protein [Cryobacterium sp. PH31-AA6]MDJ0323196.1 hypothetical protein [Cryobacterium sp. PH31-AA6]